MINTSGTLTDIEEDVVNRPSHYRSGDVYETIKVIEAWELNYRVGNAVKYISRYLKKDDPVENLEKAIWYLRREVEQIKRQREREQLEAQLRSPEAKELRSALGITNSKYDTDGHPMAVPGTPEDGGHHAAEASRRSQGEAEATLVPPVGRGVSRRAGPPTARGDVHNYD